MKKVRLYNFINLVITLLFGVTLTLQGVLKLLPIEFARFYFPCFLFYVSCSLFFKFIIFKNPAILWFSCNLFLVQLALFLVYFSPLTNKQFWPIYLLIPAVCSLVVGVGFKNPLHLSLFTFLIMLAIPLFLLTYDILSVGYFILVLFISLLLSSFMIKIIITIHHKYRKKCNGKVWYW